MYCYHYSHQLSQSLQRERHARVEGTADALISAGGSSSSSSSESAAAVKEANTLRRAVTELREVVRFLRQDKEVSHHYCNACSSNCYLCDSRSSKHVDQAHCSASQMYCNSNSTQQVSDYGVLVADNTTLCCEQL
jgi:hypothetical protein